MDSHFDTLEFDPFIQPNLIQPLETRDISSSLISDLYREEQLTQDEYIVLDFIGTIKEKKSGDVIMSFQGIKRLVSLHQAKLTKA
ncbi:MAG: hypothetical protein OEY49_02765, partial [Candidatus Heimdallarchaeota archaeon]|nr:hypothetical protein [Candidatus Heimdallarchaeota archaeon]